LLKSVGLRALAVDDTAAITTNYQTERSGCLLLDIQHLRPSDFHAQQCLREWGTNLPVIIIAGYSDASLAVNVIRQGVLGFIEKPFND
jgi:two-component system response regulator FixJ